MSVKKRKKSYPIIESYDEIPDFAAEDEEREWWATHNLADELWEDVTEEQKALIQRLRAKYHHVRTDRKKIMKPDQSSARIMVDRRKVT